MYKSIGALIILVLFGGSVFASDYRIKNKSYNNYNVETIDIEQRTIKFDSRLFLGLDGYYEINDKTAYYDNSICRESETVKKLLEEVKTNTEQLKALRAELIKLNGGEPPKDDQPTTPDESIDEGKIATELDKQVFPIFNTSCKTCHGPDNQQKGLQLIGMNDDGVEYLIDQPLPTRLKIHNRTAGTNLHGKKLMPVGGPPLDGEKVKILEDWALEKAGLLK